MPPNTVKVARPTKWGNPWRVGQFSSTLQRVMDRRDAVGRYKAECNNPMGLSWVRKLAPVELRGKNLACFCPLDQPCHADVLLEIANQ